MLNLTLKLFKYSFLSLGLAVSLGACGFHAPTQAEEYNPSEHSDHRIDLTSRSDVTEIYQMLKDTHEVFSRCHLQYWADGGTLLGAIRNQGVIPWDDDSDTAILSKDVAKLLILRPIFADLGYFIEQVFFGYRIVKTGTSAQVDILVMNEENGVIHYSQGDWGSRVTSDPATGQSIKTPIYLRSDEVFPLREVDFGPIRVMIPNNPNPYLDAMYRGWNEVAFTYGHAGQRKYRINLDIHTDFRRPAPLDPETHQTIDVRGSLTDRVPRDLRCPTLETDHRPQPIRSFYDGV